MQNHKIKRLLALIPVFFLIILSFSCGSEFEDLGEDYGNILDSPSGLILTESEHIYGWERDDCLACHNLNNIHITNRTGISIDTEVIQNGTFEDGESGCSTCHGSNGI